MIPNERGKKIGVDWIKRNEKNNKCEMKMGGSGKYVDEERKKKKTIFETHKCRSLILFYMPLR